MQVIAVVGSRVEADLMVGMLLEHGIDASVSGDDVGGIDLALQAQGVRVLVADDDVARARELLGLAGDAGNAGATGPRLNRLQRMVVRLLGGPARP